MAAQKTAPPPYLPDWFEAARLALGLTQAQLISVGMILAGGIWLLLARRGDPRPAPA